MLSRQPITDANYEAAMAEASGRAIVSNVTAKPRIVTVRSMAEWIRSQAYITQDILDRAFTRAEQRLFEPARELALKLSGDVN